jgi:RHS repeat-associated protein
VTNINALGETTITTMDALGRTTSTQIYGASGVLARETYLSYSADHNSVTIASGSGANAVFNTAWTDNDGHTVLSIAYPSANNTEFTLNQFDLAGNLVSAQHNSSASGAVTTWTTTSQTFDGLNRPTSKSDRDNAVTTYAYDPLNDLTNRTMPGGLQWQATYNNAGQMLQEQNFGGGIGTRTNAYTYFASGSPFAGLLQTKTDGRGTSCAYSYDDWLRPTNIAYSGSLSEQQLTTTLRYEPRGFITGITEQFASTNTGPTTTIQRSYDPYGQLASESVNAGSFSYGTGQSWDPAGRRTQLGIGGSSYGFSWRADGALTSANDSTGSGGYSYDTAGLLTNRIVGVRTTSITSRDGEGRPLSIATKVSGVSQLSESFSWLGDGLLATHTLTRSDFTDSRAYSYASLSRRLVQEQLNLNGSTTWTNALAYDNGVAAGPGVLTQMGQANSTANLWSGIADSFSRVATETNSTFQYPAYGHVNGQSTLNAWLDNQPVSVTGVGTNAMQWRAMMELSPGTHQLKVAALHPSGQFTAWTTNSFTNNIAYQTTADTFDGAGNVTQRVWKNPNGTTSRTQTLSWDARGRLHMVSERDSSNSGYDWTATYDGSNRRLQTTTLSISNGVALNVQPATINSYFDPQVEFLELGVAYGTKTEWKLYGPDLNGKYGGLNGTGGFDAVSPGLSLFNPTISDARGNILGYYDSAQGSVVWNSARSTGYGAVPGYRPLALANGANVAQSSAWRGRWVDITGYHQIGLRPYDPISGRWLTFDSAWNEGDPNYYTFAGGEPIMGFDPDGRISQSYYQNSQSANPFDPAMQGITWTWQLAAYPSCAWEPVLLNGQSSQYASSSIWNVSATASYYNQVSANGLNQGGIAGYAEFATAQMGEDVLDFFGATGVQQSAMRSGAASANPSQRGTAWGYGAITAGSILINAIPGEGKTATLVAEEGVKLLEADAAKETIYVLGRQVDTDVAKDWAGHSVLDIPDWTLAKNDAFIQKIIDEGGTAYLGSPQIEANLWDAANNRMTVFARELEQLKKAGYKRQGNYMLPPSAH